MVWRRRAEEGGGGLLVLSCKIEYSSKASKKKKHTSKLQKVTEKVTLLGTVAINTTRCDILKVVSQSVDRLWSLNCRAHCLLKHRELI